MLLENLLGDLEVAVVEHMRFRQWQQLESEVSECAELLRVDATFLLHQVMVRTMARHALSLTEDNVVPYIPKEEEKVETETWKILAKVAGNSAEPAAFRVSATCTRVPVLEGHTEVVHVALKKAATVEDVKRVLREYGEDFLALKLPSAPAALARGQHQRPPHPRSPAPTRPSPGQHPPSPARRRHSSPS